jgi:hypothetical protein
VPSLSSDAKPTTSVTVDDDAARHRGSTPSRLSPSGTITPASAARTATIIAANMTAGIFQLRTRERQAAVDRRPGNPIQQRDGDLGGQPGAFARSTWPSAMPRTIM